MRLQIGIPEAEVSEEVLDAALETVTRLDERLVGNGMAPTFHDGLRDRNIRWRPEPPGLERFDNAATVMRRGWGDCDDLAPWRAASMRHTGEDPEARAVAMPSGPNRWHAVVQRSDGTLEDPSREAGMGRCHGIPGIPAAVCAPMFRTPTGVSGSYRPRAAVAIRPNRGSWEARADLPWSDADASLVALQRSPVASQALVGALIGATYVGEAAGIGDQGESDVLMALAALLDGHAADDVLDALPPESVARVCSILPTLAAYCEREIQRHVFAQYQQLTNPRALAVRGMRAAIGGEPGGPMIVRF